MIPGRYQGHTVRIGKVVDTHPKGNCVDVILLDNLARLEKVQVVSHSAFTDGGTVNLPQVTVREGDEKWSVKLTGERDMLAAVMMTDIRPIVVGFLPLQVNQMAFDKDEFPNLFIERHASDLYRSIDAQGQMTIRHPAGTEITIGEPSTLEGKDYDGKFQVKYNIETTPKILLKAGSSTITILPSGDILIEATGDVVVRGQRIYLN